jgi:hypothetical protein
MTCQPRETATLLTNRLLSCVQRYTVSRQVQDFNSLISLPAADRVKRTLSEPCLRYTLSIEATTDKGWLDHGKLAKSIDFIIAIIPKTDLWPVLLGATECRLGSISHTSDKDILRAT